jgi:hypothetical protein
MQIFTWNYRFGELNFVGRFNSRKRAKMPSFFVRLSFVHGSFILYSKYAAPSLKYCWRFGNENFFGNYQNLVILQKI